MLAKSIWILKNVPDKSGIRWVMGRFIFDGDNMIVQYAIQKAGLPILQNGRFGMGDRKET